jgi:ferredoxin
VTRIEEFSWKKLLDLHTCTECGRCDVFCPALNSDKPLSPKQFTIDLRGHLNAQTPALLNKEGSEGAVLLGSAIQDATVWSCTTCGACEEECPVMIEYVNKMVDLRRGLVLTEDRYPKELGEAFKSLETHSNPWGFPGTQRTDWAEGLEIKQWDKDNPTEYLYFVGCNGSFDSRGKKVSESVVRALQKAGVDFSILGNREGCTGDRPLPALLQFVQARVPRVWREAGSHPSFGTAGGSYQGKQTVNGRRDKRNRRRTRFLLHGTSQQSVRGATRHFEIGFFLGRCERSRDLARARYLLRRGRWRIPDGGDRHAHQPQPHR